MKDNVKNWFKELKRENLLWGMGGIVVLLLVFMYFWGYNPKDVFLVGKSGILSIELPLIQTNVFIDEVKKVTTAKENETLEFSLSPKKHSVIISRDGYYPWTKEFIISNKKTLKLTPIFININTTGQIITNTDPEYWKLKRETVGNIPPTKNSPEISMDGIARLWMDDNAILVTIASSTYNVIQPDTIIRNVSFYRNRSDIVIFSTSNAIYVIEVNKEGKQNFMPVYKGVSPSFIKTNPAYIYVWDNETLLQVII